MKVLIAIVTFGLFTLNAQAAVATHGMVVFGKENLYAYHLPMFHKTHNKQVVITFDVPKDVKDQLIRLEDTTFLTFVPAPFDLEKFIAAPFDLKGDLYSGHFEKDGVVVLADITLTNVKVLYAKELVTPTPKAYEFYKIFGTKNDTYAIHLLQGSKVDQIFKLATTYTIDFENYALNLNVSSKGLLEAGSELEIMGPPGKCPSRNCGSPGDTWSTFKVESLYFSDDVM